MAQYPDYEGLQLHPEDDGLQVSPSDGPERVPLEEPGENGKEVARDDEKLAIGTDDQSPKSTKYFLGLRPQSFWITFIIILVVICAAIGAAVGATSRPRPASPTCTHGPGTRNCWSDGFDIDTDTYEKWPTTGKVVRYELEITQKTMQPDGLLADMLVVNGQYPGPTVYADWGDTLSITATNSLPENGTGLHWHGIRQFHTNQMDGVPGVTECPIVPGASRTYTFVATQHGTSWYHSHYSTQYGDGLAGPLVINGPSTADYDIDLGVLPVTDWIDGAPPGPIYTDPDHNQWALDRRPVASNFLINGSMLWWFNDTVGQYAVTTLTPGKKHLLRLVNTSAASWLHVSLDSHSFLVVSADFTPVKPFSTKSLSMAIGQRYNVVIEANQTTGSYWFRVGSGNGGWADVCDEANINENRTKSIFRYHGAQAGDPKSTPSILPIGCYDEMSLEPYVSANVPPSRPSTIAIAYVPPKVHNTSKVDSNEIPGLWTINKTAIKVDWAVPSLQQIASNDLRPFRNASLNTTSPNEWVYWHFTKTGPATDVAHSMHLHGHDMYILGSGTNFEQDAHKLNFTNPMRRDTAAIPGGDTGYLVVAFRADNPGIWLMNDQNLFLMAAGLGFLFVDNSSDIIGTLGDLGDLKADCKNWTASGPVYPGANAAVPLDSGL
ncbi:hypothetical protein NA57DRAFT_68888 [Rhizodiscina lignyota]|uniref:Multicopper oxidase n=1 Tax=Rhizodiscina lignyota TaxID=1504668 RepID=A0A9P4M417_9PEZI|nr:hypothetical protein NA57DRAFT_68888 [Rhizodiscina lignyota]